MRKEIHNGVITPKTYISQLFLNRMSATSSLDLKLVLSAQFAII